MYDEQMMEHGQYVVNICGAESGGAFSWRGGANQILLRAHEALARPWANLTPAPHFQTPEKLLRGALSHFTSNLHEAEEDKGQTSLQDGFHRHTDSDRGLHYAT